MDRNHATRRGLLAGAGALLAACAPGSDVERVAAADIPVGGGTVVGDYVVTQPEEGVFKAFSARCPHQGGTINAVRDGVMICPDHNSHFDIETGDVVSGPSRNAAWKTSCPSGGTEESGARSAASRQSFFPAGVTETNPRAERSSSTAIVSAGLAVPLSSVLTNSGRIPGGGCGWNWRR